MKQRIYSLDALKFFAATMIVFHHFQQDMVVRFPGINFFGEGTYYGYLVELFFMISGYLAAKGIERIREISFWKYYIIKAIRIYPMAFFATGVYCVLALLYNKMTGIWFGDAVIDGWNALVSLLLISHGGIVLNVTIAANNPIWYLCVLLICYVILYFVYKATVKSGIPLVIFSLGMVVLGVGIRVLNIEIPFFNYYTGRGYMAFFLGVVLMCVLEKCRKKEFLKIGALFALPVGVLVAIVGIPIFALIFIIYPAILILFTESKTIQMIFRSRIWEELGGISFEMYLWHCSIMLALVIGMRVLDWKPSYDTYGFMLIFTSAVVGISAVLYYVVEKKLTIFLKKVFEERGYLNV